MLLQASAHMQSFPWMDFCKLYAKIASCWKLYLPVTVTSLLHEDVNKLLKNHYIFIILDNS